jgi:hypothetical protein
LYSAETVETYQILLTRLGAFVSMRDYFVYEVNTEAMAEQVEKFSNLCNQAMDFTLLEAGNKVNMATAVGPY